MEETHLCTSILWTLLRSERQKQSKSSSALLTIRHDSLLEGSDLFGEIRKCRIILRTRLEEEIQIAE